MSLPELREGVGTHVDVPENRAEGADLQSCVAVHGDVGAEVILTQNVVTASDTRQMESLLLEERDHLLAGWTR